MGETVEEKAEKGEPGRGRRESQKKSGRKRDI